MWRCSRQWSVWLPPGYAVVDFDDRLLPGAIGPVTWSNRLFGLFSGASGGTVFNPLVGNSCARRSIQRRT